jgi:hypothetical protein
LGKYYKIYLGMTRDKVRNDIPEAILTQEAKK